MVFGVPGDKLKELVEGLRYNAEHGHGYPIKPNLIMTTPRPPGLLVIADKPEEWAKKLGLKV